MEKVCNARFIETMDNYNEKMGLVGKGALGLRPKLLAAASARQAAAAGATNHAVPVPTFNIILRGENGAVGEKLLKGIYFVLSGYFGEVSPHKTTAEDGIKKMITYFGGDVKNCFSKNTSKCFAISKQRIDP